MECGMPAPLSSPVSWSLLKLMSTESMMLSNHPLPPSSFALFISNIRVFSSELALFLRWPKYWSFSFSISPYSEYSGLISFRIESRIWSPCCSRDSQKSSPTPQFKNINSSALSFIVQLSHLYMTTGKTIALTIWFENSMNSVKRPHIGGLQWLMTMTFMFILMAGNIPFLINYKQWLFKI